MSARTRTILVQQTHQLSTVFFHLSAMATAPASTTIASSPTAMTIFMLSNTLNPIILYLQEVTANDLIPYIFHVIAYNKAQDTPHLEIILMSLQDLTAYEMVILYFSDVKSANQVFPTTLRIIPH